MQPTEQARIIGVERREMWYTSAWRELGRAPRSCGAFFALPRKSTCSGRLKTYYPGKRLYCQIENSGKRFQTLSSCLGEGSKYSLNPSSVLKIFW